MSENKMSSDWLNEDEYEDATEEVFGGSFESDRIEGYGTTDAKIAMAYIVSSGSSEAEAIKILFVNKDGKKLEETFWVKGKDGKPFTVKNGKKVQTFGVNKIRSLIKVTGLFNGEKNLMKALYDTVKEADVTETNYGKEETNEQKLFYGLLGAKVKLCVSSKKVNATINSEQDDNTDAEYVKQCIKNTKKFIIANPKKKSLKKYDISKGYVNVYKWFTETSIQHFCSIDGKFASEIDSEKEPTLLKQFIDANDEGFISDARTLIPDEMTDKELAKLSINKYGKRVEPSDDSEDDYEEPTEDTEEESDDYFW